MFRKILFPLAFISFFSVICAGFFFNDYFERRLLRSLDRDSQQLSQRLEAKYQEEKQKAINHLSLLGDYLVLNGFNDEFNEFSKSFKNLFNYIEVYAAPLSGEFYSSSGFSMNARAENRPWFMEISNGSSFYKSDIYNSLGDGGTVLTFAMPVKDGGQLIGVVGVDVDASRLLNDSSEFAITDEKGMVFATDSINSEWLGGDMFEIRPIFKDSSSVPLVYKNPKGQSFSVTKTMLEDGSALYSILAVDDLILNKFNNLIVFSVLSSALSGVLFLSFWFCLRRELIGVFELSKTIERVSQGHLIMEDLPRKGNELDYISDSISSLCSNVGRVISNVSTSMHQVNLGQQSAFAVIKANQANSLNELSSIEQIATASTELSSTARDVADSAQRAEQSAIEANDIIQISHGSLKNSTETTEKISKSISETQTIVSLLREHSDRISSVVNVINNISEQTNLLALNAAIEAARAGEQGRGFAVVADEVRALAGKTQQSTIDIQQIITQLQDQSKRADESMGRNVELMGLTQSTTDELIQSFYAISEKVSSISEVNSIVATASEEQSAVTADISNQLENMSVLVQQNIEGIEKSVEANKAVVEVTKELSSELAFFKVEK